MMLFNELYTMLLGFSAVMDLAPKSVHCREFNFQTIVNLALTWVIQQAVVSISLAAWIRGWCHSLSRTSNGLFLG